MKNTCVLKFSSLSDLALFLRLIQSKGYTVNTVRLTLTANLSPFELSLAIENYNAEELQRVPA